MQGKVNATEIWASLCAFLSSEPLSCLLGAREDKRVSAAHSITGSVNVHVPLGCA